FGATSFLNRVGQRQKSERIVTILTFQGRQQATDGGMVRQRNGGWTGRCERVADQVAEEEPLSKLLGRPNTRPVFRRGRFGNVIQCDEGGAGGEPCRIADPLPHRRGDAEVVDPLARSLARRTVTPIQIPPRWDRVSAGPDTLPG